MNGKMCRRLKNVAAGLPEIDKVDHYEKLKMVYTHEGDKGATEYCANIRKLAAERKLAAQKERENPSATRHFQPVV